ncbi:MAG: hypothetical protein HKO10_05305 [Acidimicrobiia bacterium]|nr:hypothetical protein [Acidimicrobiia bacterium]
MPELETITGRRIIALPAVLDAVMWPEDALVARLAPDDVFLIGAGDLDVADEHAIIDEETGFSGIWLERRAAADWCERNATWGPVPDGLAQGMAAGLPVKALTVGDRVLLLVASVLAKDLEERLA